MAHPEQRPVLPVDAFLERCHGVLDFAQTVVQFTKLGRIEVGGTKGKQPPRWRPSSPTSTVQSRGSEEAKLRDSGHQRVEI